MPAQDSRNSRTDLRRDTPSGESGGRIISATPVAFNCAALDGRSRFPDHPSAPSRSTSRGWSGTSLNLNERGKSAGRTATGSVTSEGDAAARADLVRGLGYDGSGIVVGIISDGIDHAASARASGDLPTVTVPADGRCTA